MFLTAPAPSRSLVTPQRGFTLVEIMIVVVVIGLLAAMAIPAFQRVREKSEHTAVANDLRVFAAAFDQYMLEFGTRPDVVMGTFPPEMVGRIKEASWLKPLPGGGVYGFSHNTAGLTTVSLHNTTWSAARLAAFDAMIDDGVITTGKFRRHGDFYIFVLQETF